MLEGLLWIAGIVGATSGYIYHFNYRDRREVIARNLAKLPLSDIRDIREDQLVRIAGDVVPLDEGVIAPISGMPCVHFQVIVERRGLGRWVPIIDVCEGYRFALDDGTGRVYVDAYNARLATHHHRVRPKLEPDPPLDDFLRLFNVLHKDSLRVCEMRLDPGARITIMGAGVSDIDPDAGAPADYRADRATRLSFVGGKNYPLVISDDPALR